MPTAPESTRGGTMDGDPERPPRRRSGPDRRESDCPHRAPPSAGSGAGAPAPIPGCGAGPAASPFPPAAGRGRHRAVHGAILSYLPADPAPDGGEPSGYPVSSSPPLAARMSDRRGAPLPFRIRRTPRMRNGAFRPARPGSGLWNTPAPAPAPFREASRAATPARAPRKAAASTVRGGRQAGVAPLWRTPDRRAEEAPRWEKDAAPARRSTSVWRW